MDRAAKTPLSGLKVAWADVHYFDEFIWEHVAEFAHFSVSDTPCDWEWIVEQCGFAPDILVVGDRSQPPMFLGLETYPCLTVFVSVDSHIHSWYPLYAQAFDLCTVSLKDHIPRYLGKRLSESQVLWSPPFARKGDAPKAVEKKWDILFVGTVDPETTPIRSKVLAYLESRLPNLHITKGSYRTLYPQARIVLNIAERGDLNYRVFEALGCGGCLVTPKIDHGQDELFVDGEDLFTYDPDDLDGLVRLLEALLDDKARRTRVARSGTMKVDTAHRASHRAEAFRKWLESHDHSVLVQDRLAQSKLIFEGALKMLYLHYAEAIDDPNMRQAYVMASRGEPK